MIKKSSPFLVLMLSDDATLIALVLKDLGLSPQQLWRMTTSNFCTARNGFGRNGKDRSNLKIRRRAPWWCSRKRLKHIFYTLTWFWFFRTDYVLTQDKLFKKYAKAYAEDQNLWFKDFANAVSRLFELGVPSEQFVSPEPWIMPTIDEQKTAKEKNWCFLASEGDDVSMSWFRYLKVPW